MNNTIDMLNTIYVPMIERSTQIRRSLESAGFVITHAGFYNNHYIRDNGGFLVEHYPIPVFSVEGVGDIGTDINSIWVEGKLSKEKAVLLDYPQLAKSFHMEVYGAQEFCDDFYNHGLDPCLTAEKIQNGNELEICVCLTFDGKCDSDEIIKAVRQLTG